MKFRSGLFYSYILLLIAYSLITLIPKPSPITLRLYHLTPTGVRLIDLSIIILLAIIWYAGFYGYSRIRSYSRLIKNDKDGKHVVTITSGLFVLVIWLPVAELVSTIFNYFTERHAALITAATITDNYINLILPFIGFVIISFGAHGLSQLQRSRLSLRASFILTVLLTYIGLIYYHLVVASPNRDMVYHLSIWLLLLTLVAPYIIMWSIGLVTVYQLYLYQLRVTGIIYRRAWRLMSLGLGWLLTTSILFQFLATLSNRLLHLSIYWVLFIIYTALLVLSIGFILIAISTRKLRKIEEV